MIFTLVSLFGNVGKAIAVVIMVFQIAGAGGIYPIQTNPKIFGILEPLWPFTYAINGFREATAGPVWSSVHQNVLALLGFAGASPIPSWSENSRKPSCNRLEPFFIKACREFGNIPDSRHAFFS